MKTLYQYGDVWHGSYDQMPARISGNRAECIIIDDPHNEDNMTSATEKSILGSYHGIDTGRYGYLGYDRVAAHKDELVQKPAKVNYNTVGVRFLDGTNISKVYTYGVRKGGKIHLGQELVADTTRGPALVAVVRIDKTPVPVNPAWPRGLQFLTRKVVEL